MPKRHLVRTADQASFEVPPAYGDLSRGFRRWPVVNGASGSVHQEFNLCELDPGGSIDPHLHTFEESLYILEGQLICETGDGSYAMEPGDYGLIQVGAPHALRNTSDQPVRWAELLAPQPRLDGDGDVFPAPGFAPAGPPRPVDPRDPRTRHFGNITPDHMDPTKQAQSLLAVSASMRTALLVYSGITVKMMVDSDLGATLGAMFMVQYEPGGLASPHDHPLEEVYLILEGEVDARFDGVPYRLRPGDIAWAGVGSPHEFKNPGPGRVRWLETQVPQLPSRYGYRFRRDWVYLEEALQQGEKSHG